MLPKVMSKDRLETFVAGLMSACEVVGPKRKPEAEKFYFDRVEHPDELRLDYPTTLLSPKKYYRVRLRGGGRFDYLPGQFVQV